jgi:hypothetical protein
VEPGLQGLTRARRGVVLLLKESAWHDWMMGRVMEMGCQIRSQPPRAAGKTRKEAWRGI